MNKGCFVSKRQIAEKFCVVERTVDDWVKRRWLSPPIKLGSFKQSKVRWTPEAVEKLDAHIRGTAKSTETLHTPIVNKQVAPTHRKKNSPKGGRSNDSRSVA
jgi:hypothetical protein